MLVHAAMSTATLPISSPSTAACSIAPSAVNPSLLPIRTMAKVSQQPLLIFAPVAEVLRKSRFRSRAQLCRPTH